MIPLMIFIELHQLICRYIFYRCCFNS